MSNKKVLQKTLSMALAVSMALAPVQAMAATDTNGHWAEKVIAQWQDKGLIKGYEDSSFKPDNVVTRAEFVSMVNNANGFKKIGDISFSDIKANDWFKNAVATAVAEGYCKGYEDNTFKPNATITRAEAAVMIANVMDLGQNENGAADFADFASIPVWARGSVGAVVEAGYMSGYPNGTFGATASITRAEAVSSLNRTLDDTEKAPEVEAPAEDVVVDKDGTVIDNQTITGNLTISEKVGNGDVTVKNTTVRGDIIVRGGGSHSVVLENVTVKGNVISDKKDVRILLKDDTEIPEFMVFKEAVIDSQNFSGNVNKITVSDKLNGDTGLTVRISADSVRITHKAIVKLEKDVDTVIIEEDADGTTLEIKDKVTVDTVIADAKTTIKGKGTIDTLEANADGIKLDKNLAVDTVETASGVDKPTAIRPPSSGGGSSSSGGNNGGAVEVPELKLINTVKDAKAKMLGVKESVDGADIPTNETWVTANVMVNLQYAIEYAEGILDGTNTAGSVAEAQGMLDAALANFKPQNGTQQTETTVLLTVNSFADPITTYNEGLLTADNAADYLLHKYNSVDAYANGTLVGTIKITGWTLVGEYAPYEGYTSTFKATLGEFTETEPSDISYEVPADANVEITLKFEKDQTLLIDSDDVYIYPNVTELEITTTEGATLDSILEQLGSTAKLIYDNKEYSVPVASYDWMIFKNNDLISHEDWDGAEGTYVFKLNIWFTVIDEILNGTLDVDNVHAKQDVTVVINVAS